MQISLLPPLHQEHSIHDLSRLARRAEDMGYTGFWYADERFYRETYAVLSACALSTSRIRLGPAVSDPYTRHAAMTAAAIATLDELSDGRAALGFGAGIAGFVNLAIEPKRPVAAVRDGIAVVRGLLSGKTLSVDGEEVKLRAGRLLFPARPAVPIFLAAEGPLMLRLAGELADAVIIYHAAVGPTLDPKLAEVDRGMRRSGRRKRPRVVARLDVSVAHDRTAALRQAKLRLGRYLWARFPDIAYLRQSELEMPRALGARLAAAGPFPKTHDLSAFEQFADDIPDELVRPIAIAGDPDEVAQAIGRLADLGVDELMLYPLVPATETLDSVLGLLHSAGVPSQ